MDRFASMAAFVAVAELRGFAPAARQLKLSPPAVTRLVAALESALNIRLLQRTTRSVSLTDAGERYLERARRILTDIDDAERLARAEHITPSGRLVVSAPNAFGRREVAPLMCDFLESYPQMTGELRLADRMVNLVDEGVDIAVRIGALEDSTLRVRTVGATRRVVVGSPAYLALKKRLRTPLDLASHHIIQFQSITPHPEWIFWRQQGENIRVRIQPVFVTNSAEAALEHAVRGGGLTMALGYQVHDLVLAGKLQVVLEKYEPPLQPIQLVYTGQRFQSASMRAFIDMTAATRAWRFVDFH